MDGRFVLAPRDDEVRTPALGPARERERRPDHGSVPDRFLALLRDPPDPDEERRNLIRSRAPEVVEVVLVDLIQERHEEAGPPRPGLQLRPHSRRVWNPRVEEPEIAADRGHESFHLLVRVGILRDREPPSVKRGDPGDVGLTIEAVWSHRVGGVLGAGRRPHRPDFGAEEATPTRAPRHIR